MKNTYMLAGAAAALITLATPALADSYFELNAGPSFASGSAKVTTLGSTNVPFSTGYNLGAGFGTNVDFLPEQFTLGAQAFFTKQSVKNAPGISNSTGSLMGVVNYHIPMESPVGLYVGGGLGVLQKDLKVSGAGTSLTISDRQFGYQLQAGAELPVSDATSLFAEYRFQGSNNAKINFPAGVGLPAGNVSLREQSHNLTFGVRFGL